MSTAPDHRRISVEEYLALENPSETKHEYYRGEIFATAGATFTHNRIFSNLFPRLADLLEGKPCEVFGSDLRIRIDAADLTTYPDILVVCGGPQVHPIDDRAVTNPRLIIEILSKSTENYDRGAKFELYQSLESFSEYVLIYQNQAKAIHYVRQNDGRWAYQLVVGTESQLDLESIGVAIPLAVIYRNVELKQETEEPEKIPRRPRETRE